MTEIELTDGAPTATDAPGQTSVDTPRPPRPRTGNPLRSLTTALDGIAAVGVKELRGRVRGRRAFVILTFYLLFLAGFAWAWELVAERAYAANAFGSSSAAFASSRVGQEVFGALVLVETLLVVFLAPASTAGAISLEREKQTLDLLAVTPISSLAIVIGKLLSALAYVFLLIAASIPLTAMVFVFGGVAPDDVIRAYVVLIVSTIGLGSLGLFISAVAQRTQGATVVTFFAVLALSLGTMFAVLFWNTMAGVGPNRPVVVPGPALDDTTGGFVGGSSTGIDQTPARPPEALLWFNPFAAQYDVICGASDGYGGWCSRLNTVTNGAITVGLNAQNNVILTTVGAAIDLPANLTDDQAAALKQRLNAAAAAGGAAGGGRVVAVNGQAGALAPDAPVQVQAFGPQRDTFWPHSVAAWSIVSVALILMSVQLVSPTRRWRLPRLTGGTRAR